MVHECMRLRFRRWVAIFIHLVEQSLVSAAFLAFFKILSINSHKCRHIKKHDCSPFATKSPSLDKVEAETSLGNEVGIAGYDTTEGVAEDDLKEGTETFL